MGIATENLIRQAIERQTAVTEAALAELRRLNEQIAWQNHVIASQAAQKVGQ